MCVGGCILFVFTNTNTLYLGEGYFGVFCGRGKLWVILGRGIFGGEGGSLGVFEWGYCGLGYIRGECMRSLGYISGGILGGWEALGYFKVGKGRFKGYFRRGCLGRL